MLKLVLKSCEIVEESFQTFQTRGYILCQCIYSTVFIVTGEMETIDWGYYWGPAPFTPPDRIRFMASFIVLLFVQGVSRSERVNKPIIMPKERFRLKLYVVFFNGHHARNILIHRIMCFYPILLMQMKSGLWQLDSLVVGYPGVYLLLFGEKNWLDNDLKTTILSHNNSVKTQLFFYITDHLVMLK